MRMVYAQLLTALERLAPMAILTTTEYVERFEDPTHQFDLDDAQTVASWWYSPAQKALTALTTTGKVLPFLTREVELEIEWAEKSTEYSESDIADLRALLAWAKEQDETEDEEY